MDLIFDIVYMNLLSPMVLFFLIGIIAVLVNSDLKVPDAVYTGYTMIILLTIGIKGGTELRNVTLVEMIPTIITAVFLSVLMFGISYIVVKYLFKLSVTNSLAIAGHYGSVSAVTFIAGIAFLDKVGVYYEAYMSAVLVIMEGPAIILAIVIYKIYSQRYGDTSLTDDSNLNHVLKEAFFGKSIFLLLGGIFIGLVAHEDGIAQISPFFGDLFYGILCIFLLHMGMVATQSIREMESIKVTSLLFAFLLPVIGGTVGIFAGYLIGLSLGGAVTLAFLTGSASYIAAPAAVSHSIPKANSGIYIGTSLGLTLPFNLIIGIPYYYWLATFIY
ncbi:sodium-dependent bicarbonate transport family permease [Bacillus shivajii]|uniref:sodium-dependent bicarbonate transport family permease n=1 Tax=Bacillus shivajii TaxID=1983719 RepID=UPI001CF9C351|nr:sodium-dependent bicarbonate transport family permease [Bacillus shivajii]UCZ51575.1 sodium-dependent bicarbonate transport family permease [Bacillus shivajii]